MFGEQVTAYRKTGRSWENGFQLALHFLVAQGLGKSLERDEGWAGRRQVGAMGFHGSSAARESACYAGEARDRGSIPGSGRSPGGGHGNLTLAVRGSLEKRCDLIRHVVALLECSEIFY